MHSRAWVQYNDQCISIVIILTAFVLRTTRIYYFDYTVNARPNACTLRVAVDRGRGEGPGNYGKWDMRTREPSRGRDDTDERQISHQRTCLLLPSASTLRRTPWTGSCAPEPAGVIHENTTRALARTLATIRFYPSKLPRRRGSNTRPADPTAAPPAARRAHAAVRSSCASTTP